MRGTRAKFRLKLVSLVLLGLLAAALSAAALMCTWPAFTWPVGKGTPGTPAPPGVNGAEDPDPAPTAAETGEVAELRQGPVVVIIGDSTSMGPPEDTWVGVAAEQLSWGWVTNRSSPGRGFLATPRRCAFTPCATFTGSIPRIVDANPDIVVTFGGLADAEEALDKVAASYFRALRRALPEAHLVAIAPVGTSGSLLYNGVMHSQAIESAVSAVDGVFVNVGPSSLGEGATLSPETHAAIAAAVVDALRTSQSVAPEVAEWVGG